MNETDPQSPNRDRLGQLFARDRLAHSLSVELVDWGGGWAATTATPGPEHVNFLGSVHGGYLFAAADVALAVASNSWGRIAVAISVDFHYLTAAPPDARLDFAAREQSRSRSLATYSLEVRSNQRTIASATGTTFRTSGWHLGEDAWSPEWRSSR